MIPLTTVTWVASILLSTILILLLSITNKYIRSKKLSTIHKQDKLIGIILYLSFYGTGLAIQISSQTPIFYFLITFSITGIILEYLGNWLWYRLMHARLYRYYKANILGLTSWYMFPIWGGAGLVFSGLYEIMNISIVIPYPQIIQSFLTFAAGALFITVSILAARDFFLGTFIQYKSYSVSLFFIFISILWGGILGITLVDGNPMILVYFIVSSFIGVILEGILGHYLLPLIFGEQLWVYQRKKLFHGGTSTIMFYLWPIASLLTILVAIPILNL